MMAKCDVIYHDGGNAFVDGTLTALTGTTAARALPAGGRRVETCLNNGFADTTRNFVVVVVIKFTGRAGPLSGGGEMKIIRRDTAAVSQGLRDANLSYLSRHRRRRCRESNSCHHRYSTNRKRGPRTGI